MTLAEFIAVLRVETAYQRVTWELFENGVLRLWPDICPLQFVAKRETASSDGAAWLLNMAPYTASRIATATDHLGEASLRARILAAVQVTDV